MRVASSPSAITFVDTNIWLYAFSASQDKQKTRLARRVIRETSRIAISTQIINEVSFNTLRKFHADEADVQKLIRTFYRKYLVVELDRDILRYASILRSTSQFAFWDSLVVSSALFVGASILYSEDMQDGLVVNNQLTIVNPLKS